MQAMVHFIPGAIVTTFSDKQGHTVTVRYPRWEDLEHMTAYINRLSQENTYIRFSGEEISKEEETAFLGTAFGKMEAQDDVMLMAMVGERMVGLTGIHRNTVNKRRSRHAAEFGISIAEEYRGRGIGEKLAQAVIEEAQRRIPGLRLVYLYVYAINERGYELYRKLGFQEVGRIPDFIFHGDRYVDEIIMIRKV